MKGCNSRYVEYEEGNKKTAEAVFLLSLIRAVLALWIRYCVGSCHFIHKPEQFMHFVVTARRFPAGLIDGLY